MIAIRCIVFIYRFALEIAMSEKQAYPSDAADKVLVRMPEGMREQLKTAAKSNNRTMNAEIVARLATSLLETAELRDTKIHAAMDILRREFEDETRLNRAQLMLATLEDQASLLRYRLDRERRLVALLRTQLAGVPEDDVVTHSRVASELQEAQGWLEQVETEHAHLRKRIADAKKERDHARSSLDRMATSTK